MTNHTILEILKKTTAYFTEKGIDSPRLTAELIFSDVLKLDRLGIYTSYDKPISQIEIDSIKQMMTRRVKGEPLQYILGYTTFYKNKFKVDKRALIPRPETELLVEEAIKKINFLIDERRQTASNEKIKILDIGCGSGCIGLSLAKEFPEIEVKLLDISQEAISLTEENSKLLEVSNLEFICQSIFDYNAEFKYDIIVSNPPYIPQQEIETLQKEVKNYEPFNALTDFGNGLKFYEFYIDFIQNYLNQSGFFLFELGFVTFSLIDVSYRQKYEVEIKKDYSGIERILIGKFPKFINN